MAVERRVNDFFLLQGLVWMQLFAENSIIRCVNVSLFVKGRR